jgi:large subunit ribosomal protein L4
MAVATFTKTGGKATTPAKLDNAVFGVDVKNHELVKQAYNAYLANGRANLAVTKTRGLVAASTRKHHRQKGTGRARAGAVSNPIWRGGGITFGPTGQENYTKQLNNKTKRQAVRQALSLASAAGKITVIEDLLAKGGKTAELSRLLAKIGATRNILIVVEQKDPELLRAARNLQHVHVISARYVTVYDVLNADCVVFNQAALTATTDWLGKTAKKAAPVSRSDKEAK